jgi:hypothetical protein
MSVIVDEGTKLKLARMRELNLALSALRAREEYDEKMADEYGTIQAEMVEEFLPLLTTLAGAGLLTSSIDGQEYLVEGYGSIAGDAAAVFENGNIWIHAEGVDCATGRPLRSTSP